jgi:hypothetical protein
MQPANRFRGTAVQKRTAMPERGRRKSRRTFRHLPAYPATRPGGGALTGGSGRWCGEAEMLTHGVGLECVHTKSG